MKYLIATRADDNIREMTDYYAGNGIFDPGITTRNEQIKSDIQALNTIRSS